MRADLRLIDDSLRQTPTANRCSCGFSPMRAIRRACCASMNEAGVLGHFIPAFRRVVSMMQFNMYHHFTVDEHLIRIIGFLSDIERGRAARWSTRCSTEIIRTIDNRRALYVAAFLHDIAKGRPEDHSRAGAKIARELGPRLGLTPSETETAVVAGRASSGDEHFAQSRDLNDPKTIRDFADLVQSRERLKLLLVLTVADLRASGPACGPAGRGSCCAPSISRPSRCLAAAIPTLSRSERVSQAQEALRERLADWSGRDLESFVGRHSPSYWLRTDTDTIAEHAKLAATARTSADLVTHISTDAFRGVTEITLLAPNHPRLLAMVAGACAGAGANIVDAQISTTRDGMALDTIHLEREFDRADDEERRAKKITGHHREIAEAARRVSPTSIASKQKPRLAPFGLHRRAASHHRQHALRRAHRDRDQRARPSRLSL